MKISFILLKWIYIIFNVLIDILHYFFIKVKNNNIFLTKN